jgi:hypothetical protein
MYISCAGITQVPVNDGEKNAEIQISNSIKGASLWLLASPCVRHRFAGVPRIHASSIIVHRQRFVPTFTFFGILNNQLP